MNHNHSMGYDAATTGPNGPIVSIEQPGTPVTGQMLHDLREDVARMLNRRQTSFPGAQPVSFTRRHLTHDLLTEDYFVCEKSDGLRYLMYLASDADGYEMIYLIDRKNDYWHIPSRNLHIPRPDNPRAFHTRTLLDGELVIDLPPHAPPQPKFLVFDCAILDGEPLMHKEFHKRLGRLQVAIIRPYEQLLRYEPERRARQPFTIELKHLESGYNASAVFRQIEEGALYHRNDGLIFTNRQTTYKFGTDEQILKWKPAHENSVDCRLRLEFPVVPAAMSRSGKSYTDYGARPRAEIWIFLGKSRGESQYRKFTDVTILEDEWRTLTSLGDPLDNRIIECYVDEHRRWRISRFRDDKPEANHSSVLEKVLQSIEDGVEKQDIINAEEAIRAAWKQRARAEEMQKREAFERGRQSRQREEQDRHGGAGFDGSALVQGRKRPGMEEVERDEKRIRPHE